MNRKGLLAKVFSTFLVFILIVFFTGILFVVVAYAVVLEKPKIPAFIEGIETENVLAKEITLKINENPQEILIFDALVEYWNRNTDIQLFQQIKESIIKMVENEAKEGYCLAIAQEDIKNPAGLTGGSASNDILIEFKNGKTSTGTKGSNPSKLANYERNGFLRQVSFKKLNDKETIYVQYYYGKCLEEIK